MRARRLSSLLVWLVGGARALSITRRHLAIGTAASVAATPMRTLASPNYDGLYEVEGSKARRRIRSSGAIHSGRMAPISLDSKKMQPVPRAADVDATDARVVAR